MSFPQDKLLTGLDLRRKVFPVQRQTLTGSSPTLTGDTMEFLLTLILVLIIAILFNWGMPKFQATKLGGKIQGMKFGTTLVTALVLLVAIYAAAFVGGAIGARLPDSKG